MSMEALRITNEMYGSEQKKSEINRINTIASSVLNPIYLERIKPILDKGKELTIKDNFEENISVVNEIVDLYQKALEIANIMPESREQKEQMNPEQNLHSYTVPPKYEDFLNFNTAVASSTRVVIEQIGPPEGVLSDASKDKDSSDISTPGWVRRTE